jgi:hypothetical protein
MMGKKREEKGGRVIEDRRERYIVFRDPFYVGLTVSADRCNEMRPSRM